MLHFDLNVSILLREYSFPERFDQAARLGFGAVEFWWPSDTDLHALARRIHDADLAVALFNFDAGDLAAGERGFLNDPQREAEFRANVPVALEFAQRVGCSKINALVGTWRADESREVQLERVLENIRWAAEQAQQAGVTIVIEALNTKETDAYIFSATDDTLRFIDELGVANVKYQYDVYHMQRMEGDIVATLREHAAQIGHIQVADAPDRHQPGTGELNYRFIFAAIEASGYAGSIGLEYQPLGSSEASFGWLPADRRGGVALDALRL